MFIVRAAIVLLVLCAVGAQAQQQPSFEVIVQLPDQDQFLVGEPIEMVVILKNLTGGPLPMILPVDGSIYGRYPQYKTTIQYPLPVHAMGTGLICGTFNPLTIDDFIVLEPYEERSIRPGYWFTFTPYTAGDYQFSLTISNQVAEENKSYEMELFGIYETTPAMMELFSAIPQETAQSAPVSIHVVSNGITIDERYHSLIGMTEQEMKRNFSSEGFIKQHEENPSMYSISLVYFHTTIHLDSNGVIDGAMTQTSNEPSIESYLKWHRGDHPEIPFILERDDSGFSPIYTVKTGYFALPNEITASTFAWERLR